MKYKTLPAYGKLIYITVVVFAFTQLWKLLVVLFCHSGYYWQDWLALPANPNSFLLRPWTVLTYMFCHADLTQNPFHIVFNMICLWYFGQYFMRSSTTRQFVTFYITSGIVSGLFFLACYNVFPYFTLVRYNTTLVGASGAIYALIVAVAMQRPEDRLGLNLFVKVVWLKMKWFAAIVLAINLFCLNAGNDGGTVCHVGGALFGLLYGWMLKRGTDITSGPAKIYDSVSRWLQGLGKAKMKVEKGGKREPISADKKRDMDYNATQRDRQEQIDAILDKISRQGYDGLTAEEKQVLFDASRRKKR